MPPKRNSVGQLIIGAFNRHGVPFSQRLSAHRSCVNALAWSRDGRWLASAGDDRRILLWDFNPVDVLSTPFVCPGPRGNVLCLAFSASNSQVFSGGLDEEILQYDVSRMSTFSAAAYGDSILRRFPQHEGSIRAISPHPQKDDLLLTGSEDGTVILHDTRVPQKPHEGVGSLSADAEVTGVQYHPVMHNVFVTSDQQGNCNLRDVRMAFGGRHDRKGLLKYVTTLAKSGTPHLSNPEVSSIVFDHTGKTRVLGPCAPLISSVPGTRLAVTFLHYLPTFYAIWDEWPFATGSRTKTITPDPQNAHQSGDQSFECSYVNACTIKNGSFGSLGLQGDCYFGAGSDDFRGYVWQLPEVSDLISRRREYSYDEWAAESMGDSIGFAKSVNGERLVPTELREPHYLVHGHRSIVNTVLFHPYEPYIATSGIERHVIVHSAFEATPALGKLTRTDRIVKQRPGHRNYSPGRRILLDGLLDGTDEAENDDSDENVISLFDEILRQEGTPDVFTIRKWHGEDSDSESDDRTGIDENENSQLDDC